MAADAPREWYERYNSEASSAAQRNRRQMGSEGQEQLPLALTCYCGARVEVPTSLSGVVIRGQPYPAVNGRSVGTRAWSVLDEHGGVLHRCASWAGGVRRKKAPKSLPAQPGVFNDDEALVMPGRWAQDHRCAVPGCERRDLSRDHIVPTSRGGPRVLDNIQILCRPHNQMKGDLSQAEFHALLGVSW